VLVPPGDSPESLRIYEALALGTPPLIVRSSRPAATGRSATLRLPGSRETWAAVALEVLLRGTSQNDRTPTVH